MKFDRRTVLTLLGAGVGSLASGWSASAQDSFSHEIQLAVDASRTDTGELRRADEQRIEAALKRRLKLFTPGGEGSVKMEGFSNIKLLAPVERITPAQLQALVRPMQLQIYHLEGLRSSENPAGRYELSSLNIVGGGKQQQSAVRFFDLKERKPIQPAEFFKRCPLLLTTADVHPSGASVVSGNGLMAVRVQFNDAGTRKLERFLRKRGEILGVVLDGEIISMSANTGEARPRKKKKGDEEQEEIPQLDILGGFNSAEEATYLAALFNAGALPVPLKVIGTRLLGEKS